MVIGLKWGVESPFIAYHIFRKAEKAEDENWGPPSREMCQYAKLTEFSECMSCNVTGGAFRKGMQLQLVVMTMLV